MTNKKHVSLKAMAEDKELDAVGKVTNFLVDPRMLKVKPGFNGRPINKDHVRQMVESLKAGATFPPVETMVEDGDVFVVDGHHRREAFLQAIADGFELKRVEARQFRGDEADRVMLMVTSQQGLPLTPLQLGVQYTRLVGLGWTHAEIAARAGRSAQHVRDSIGLTEADPKARKLLEAGKVSAEVVRTAMRKHGAGAGEVLEADVEAAQAAGKAKVTAKVASTKAPTKLQTALDLLERLRDHVEALDGTTMENEVLVDDYRSFMGTK